MTSVLLTLHRYIKVVESLKVLSCLLDLQMNEQKDSPYSLMTIPSKRWPPLLNDHKSTHLLFILLFLLGRPFLDVIFFVTLLYNLTFASVRPFLFCTRSDKRIQLTTHRH